MLLHACLLQASSPLCLVVPVDVPLFPGELAAQMTEYPVGVTFSLDGLSMEQLAELVGGIGKDLDSAFAAGEISEQEYDALNKGLAAYTEFMTEKAEKEK